MMSGDGWITIAVIVGMVIVMAANLVGPDLVLIAGVTVLLLTGIIEPSEAFTGFSNPAVITIAALFVVGEGLFRTGVAFSVGNWLVKNLVTAAELKRIPETIHGELLTSMQRKAIFLTDVEVPDRTDLVGDQPKEARTPDTPPEEVAEGEKAEVVMSRPPAEVVQLDSFRKK